MNKKPTPIFKFSTSTVLNWLIHIITYALVLMTISTIFPKTLYINNNLFGLWAILASLIIFILNKTIKPIIVWLTLPITALTFGISYPIINVLILNIVDLILRENFIVRGFIMSFIVAILISLINRLIDKVIIKQLIGREK